MCICDPLCARKALVFFDRHIPRDCARAEYIDEYNLLTAQEPQRPLPEPEDFFKDESRIHFHDIESIVEDSLRLAAEFSAVPERTLEPLERHRLTAFYEDVEEHMKGAMQMREFQRVWPDARLTWEPELVRAESRMAAKRLDLDSGYGAWEQLEARLNTLDVSGSWTAFAEAKLLFTASGGESQVV